MTAPEQDPAAAAAAGRRPACPIPSLRTAGAAARRVPASAAWATSWRCGVVA
ncbi:hypothetical protein [Paractinoplanes durhamensis]|uniref:hypothetical protein n=1 Tax=Paractinoplanes durhamensis TaxID=113563 RepID=UPI001944CC8A|nr:hypothetical protein [Actinoplanes durhamensis]